MGTWPYPQTCSGSGSGSNGAVIPFVVVLGEMEVFLAIKDKNLPSRLPHHLVEHYMGEVEPFLMVHRHELVNGNFFQSILSQVHLHHPLHGTLGHVKHPPEGPHTDIGVLAFMVPTPAILVSYLDLPVGFLRLQVPDSL